MNDSQVDHTLMQVRNWKMINQFQDNVIAWLHLIMDAENCTWSEACELELKYLLTNPAYEEMGHDLATSRRNYIHSIKPKEIVPSDPDAIENLQREIGENAMDELPKLMSGLIDQANEGDAEAFMMANALCEAIQTNIK